MDIHYKNLLTFNVAVPGLIIICIIAAVLRHTTKKLGPQMIDRAYKTAEGKAFKVFTPSNNHLLVTSNELIKELIDAPLEKLSLHAVAKEILQPKHTMCSFEWQDQRGVEGTGFVRSLRSLLTAHLPKLEPDLARIIDESLSNELGSSQTDDAGYTHSKLFPLIKRTVTRVNCFIFFGSDLSQNEEFTAAALEFPQAVVFAAELLRITPEFLRPLVASLATRQHQAAKTLFRYLEPIVKERLAIRAADGGDSRAAADCIQWLIDTSPRKNPWSPARMIGEIMAVWFGSVHQLSMTTTYAIEDLCLHPEYVESLRDEIRQVEGAVGNMEKLRLLDSFLKESIRCSNSDAITGRRKALVPYVFQDGSSLAKGDWVCVPQRAMMQDTSRYADAKTFNGFRFIPLTADESSLTEVSIDWPIWGFGNTACPGRFYASLVLKLVMVRVLEDWECRMLDPDAPRSRTWRSSIVPRNDTVVLFRRRRF